MTVVSESNVPTTHPLAEGTRIHRQRIAVRGEPITYKALAEVVEVGPPSRIHQVTEALEWLMREDAANEHPFIAALVMSRARGGPPPAGFFDIAKELRRFDGGPSSPDAGASHGAMLSAAATFWSVANLPDAGNAA